MRPKKYYTKNKEGQVKMSWGIELLPHEQQALCRENLSRISQQHKVAGQIAMAVHHCKE